MYKHLLQFKSFTFFHLIPVLFASSFLFQSCNRGYEGTKEEQVAVSPEDETSTNDSLGNQLTNTMVMNDTATYPNRVILTGMSHHRLVSIYKRIKHKDNRSGSFYSSSEGGYSEENNEHFMPGIDVLYGYNLVNIAHYDFQTEKQNLLFKRPVLVKSLYYPSFVQDSMDNKPINRDFYLVSVYNEDTNKDTLLNRKDLRHFYWFDATGAQSLSLLPTDFSVLRSDYDPDNDAMYLFAKQDKNKNGMIENNEPIHLFWISLKKPEKAKLVY
jgi:hypothetical protein